MPTLQALKAILPQKNFISEKHNKCFSWSMAKLNLLVTLFFACTCVVPGCYSLYWRFRPEVTFSDGVAAATLNQVLVGSYAEYSSYEVQLSASKLLLVTEDDFACSIRDIVSSNASVPLSMARPNEFVIMMPKAFNECSDYEKAYFSSRVGAAGVLFYYFPTSSDEDKKFSAGRSKVTIPVAAIEISEATLATIARQTANNTVTVSIIGKYFQSLQTSQTFYFVVFSFCILTILSCLWFMLSYIRKCRTRAQRRRRRAEAASETRRLVNSLPLKTHKSGQGAEEFTCAICLEFFHNKDTIRVLPCDHEFHKKCIDPWLKIKRNCPMCKEDISTQNKATSKPTNQRRAVRTTRSGSVSTDDSSSLQLLSHGSSTNSLSSHSEDPSQALSATNRIPLTDTADNEPHSVVVVEEAQENNTLEYNDVVGVQATGGRQVAIGIDGDSQVPSLNTPA